jgi:hypothetical protein
MSRPADSAASAIGCECSVTGSTASVKHHGQQSAARGRTKAGAVCGDGAACGASSAFRRSVSSAALLGAPRLDRLGQAVIGAGRVRARVCLFGAPASGLPVVLFRCVLLRCARVPRVCVLLLL